MSEAGEERVEGLQAASLLSGAAALVAETLWVRSFSAMLGATVEAAAATFSAFLVGLAVGAYLAGRVSDRLERPALTYVAVELAIAVSSIVAGLGLFHFRDQLIIGGTLVGLARAVVAFSVVLALVSIPTALMGATFPLMVAAVRRTKASMTIVGRLYTLNTLGAAAGALLCGFALIDFCGVRGSVVIGGCFNLAAAACVLVARKTPRRPESLPKPTAEAAPALEHFAPPAHWVLLLVSLSSGAMTLAVEVIWTRLASYFLGNRVYAFSTLLAGVLILLSLGSRLAERFLARANRRLPETFAALLLICAASTLVCGWLADWWIRRTGWIEAHLAFGPALVLWQMAKTLFLLCPMLIPMGCLFPLSLTTARLTRERAGSGAGLFYLVNTAGAVLGSLLVGFWSLSELGTFGSIAALVTLAAAVSVLVSLSSVPARRLKLVGVAAATAVFSSIYWVLPPQLTVLGEKESLVFRREDAYGVFQVVRLPDSTLQVTENRTPLVYHLGALSTSYVQQMQGHLGVFFNPGSRKALVLGSGYGITAGALSTYPQLERIDAVEIIPAMVESADLFMPFNLGYHRDRRVRVIVNDGRHFLASRPDTYDIISINVTDPRLPGASAFFHRDFYEIVKQHLEPGGVVIQHAYGTELATLLSTLASSFSNIQMFPAYGNGYNVIAATHPLVVDPAAIERLSLIPSVRAALEGIGIIPPFRPARVYSHGLTPSDVPRLFAEARIATDDHPVLEFSRRGDPRSLFVSNE